MPSSWKKPTIHVI
jgi:hypothetical protein